MKTDQGPRVSIPLFLLNAIIVIFLVSAIAGAQTVTYSNTTPITLRNNNVASIYPSTINVSGATGRITRVKVTLHGFTQRPSDMGVLLVAPGNANVMLMRGVGGSTAVNNLTLTFDDYAAEQIGTTLSSGIYRPSNAGNHGALPAPAPPSSPLYGRALRDLIGRNANGDWSLYINDDVAQGSAGSLSGGWSLEITYGQVFSTNLSPGIINIPAQNTARGIANPYPAPLTVTGLPTSYVTKVAVRLTGFSHTFPDDVALLLVGPGGQKVKLLSDSGGGGEFLGTTASYMFDSTAASIIPDFPAVGTSPIPGVYRPSNGTTSSSTQEGDVMPANFPSPAPPGPYETDLAAFYGTQPNGVWSLYAYDDTFADSGYIENWSLILELIAPTSAPVDLSGRVTNVYGSGIRNVAVTVQGGDLRKPITVMTGTFGRYRISGLISGQTYIVSVGARKYVFSDPVRIIDLSDELTDLDFIASP